MLLFDGLLLSLAAQRPLLAACLELHGEHGFVPPRAVRPFARSPVRPTGDARLGPEARGPAGPSLGPARESSSAHNLVPRMSSLIRARLLAWWPAREQRAGRPAWSSTKCWPPSPSESQTTAPLFELGLCLRHGLWHYPDVDGLVADVRRCLPSPTVRLGAAPSIAPWNVIVGSAVPLAAIMVEGATRGAGPLDRDRPHPPGRSAKARSHGFGSR